MCSRRSAVAAAAITLLGALLLPIVSARADSDAPGMTISAVLQWSALYMPDEWQPLVVELRNETSRVIGGTAVIPLADPRAPASMRLPVTVPAHSRVREIVWGYFPRAPRLTSAQRTPPLATVEWRGIDGAVLARSELLGMSLTAMRARGARGAVVADTGDELAQMVLVVDARSAEAVDELLDANAVLGRLGEVTGTPLGTAVIAPDAFPRVAPPLHAVKAVVLQEVDPDAFDVAQREALREYVRGGGTMLIPAPSAAAGRAGTWLAPLLPVRVVSTRLSSQVEMSAESPPLKLRQLTEISEAIEASGANVLVRGRDYVHVATRRMGLGRVVFTSFPINALDESQPQAMSLWEMLLELNELERGPEWNESQLGATRHQVLGAMIGRKVAPWGVAAAVVGGYLALVLAGQLVFFGPARPKAFVLSIAAALLLSGVLIVLGITRHGHGPLQVARLAVIDVSADGGGWQQESIACVGVDDAEMALEPSDERVMLRPALADTPNPPAVRQQPFDVENAGVFADRIERVWEASGPVDHSLRVEAVARFGAQGLTLDVRNDLGAAMEEPLVLWNRRALATPDLPAGRSTLSSWRVNAPEDFAGLGMLSSELSKRREQIVKSSISPPGEQAASAERPGDAPMLIGWLPEAAAPSLLRVRAHGPMENRSMVLVRAPLRIDSPQPGTKLSIPAALIQIQTPKLPYDRDRGETVPSQEQGSWLIGFAAPPQLGTLRPTRATLQLRVNLPAHMLTFRKGLCRAGIPEMSAQGDLVRGFGGEIGSRQVSFDCAPEDYDAAGRIWLRMEVQSQTASSGGSTSTWQIKDVAMSMDAAEAVAPPAPVSLDSTPRSGSSEEKH